MSQQTANTLEGFLAALVEDIKDDDTWSVFEDWMQDNPDISKHRIAREMIQAVAESAPTQRGARRCQEVELYDGWTEAEPGTCDYLAVGNWNTTDRHDGPQDASPDKLGRMLEKLGFDLQWSYQVSSCGECGKLIQTQPDCWSWRPRYEINDGEIVCHACRAPQEEEQADEPQPDDYVTSNYQEFHQNGRIVVRVGEGEDWRAAVRERMEREQYWPNCWLEEERGGYTLLSFEDS